MALLAQSADSWELRSLPKTEEPYDGIQFMDDRTGWIVGNFPGSLRTDDGGEHWTELDSNVPGARIESASFVSKNLGWAIAVSNPKPLKSADHILFTKDGGRSWQIQRSLSHDGGFTYLVEVWFLDSQHGWAVGRHNVNAFVLFTSDGGKHWKEIFEDRANRFNGELRRIRFTDLQNGWAIPGLGGLLRTTDGGKTWTVQYDPPHGIPDRLTVIDASEAWAVGGWGGLWHTVDTGKTWETAPVPDGKDIFFVDVAFADRLHGWVDGAKGELFSTNDAGKTWRREESHTSNVLRSIAVTPSRVLVLADPSRILVGGVPGRH